MQINFITRIACIMSALFIMMPLTLRGDAKNAELIAEATTVATDSVTVKPVSKPMEQFDPFCENGMIGHFTWGADVGSGVDLTSHDMTMFNIMACFGYKGSWVRFAGVGAGIISMMNNSSRCYPIYGMLRTSFSRYHRLCFLEAQAGASFNMMHNYKTQTGFYGSLGVGLTLAHSRKFTSHVVLRAVYMPLSPIEIGGVTKLKYDLGYACIGIGCAF